MAGTMLSADSGGFVTSETFAPQLTRLECDGKGQVSFRHTHMPPGEYIVYVKRDGVMVAWKAVTVKPGCGRSSIG